MKRNSQQGFTLIEVLLVVVIIGILAALVVPRLVGRSQEARISAAKADLRTIAGALDRFEMENGFFPTTDQGLQALIVEPTGGPELKKWSKYLKGDEVPKDPWDNEYIYKHPAEASKDDYDLYSVGLDGQPGTEDDVNVQDRSK